ncbi:MAG TPA: aspartyl protease family protein [Pirellulales bacterium]|nr:aspartyl protease family protein [Pirellulales bacterium]
MIVEALRVASRMTILATVLWQASVANAQSDGNKQTTNVIARFAVDTIEDLMFVLLPATIQGKSCFVALDTGSSTSVLDISWRPVLGEPVAKGLVDTGLQGDVAVDYFRAPQISLGGLQFGGDGAEVLCQDLKPFRELAEQMFDGIVGMNVLEEHVLRIDVDDGSVMLLKAPDVPSGTPALPLKSVHGNPALDVTIEGNGIARFMLDTGSLSDDSGTLAAPLFRSLTRRRLLLPVEHASATTLGGQHDVQAGRLQTRLSVGDLTLDASEFTEAYDNSLGLHFLSRYVVTFDFPNEVVYLEPLRRMARTLSIAASGIDLIRSRGQYRVTGVRRGGIAQMRGFREGDILESINGIEASSLRICALRLVLSPHRSDPLRIVLRRDKRMLRLTWRFVQEGARCRPATRQCRSRR